MSKFIEGVKNYLNVRNIRQTYVSLMTGWDKSRVSKVLNGTIELKESEAEFLAKALGHDMTYFLDSSVEEYREIENNGQLAFFAGTLAEEDKKIADKLVEMFRFYDALAMLEM
ncbi:MAG: helix-turn-helix transcriptional regulator [Ruminococcus sp.]|nr:helix-turn-helix transcriptional regulator [Ruminococcus sp.]